MAYNSFENLEVCQKACRLAVRLYVVLGECKDYGLKNQMTKAGVSVASNIAEGAERSSAAEFIRFLHIAKGSSAELRTQIYIARRIEILSNQVETELIAELKSISSMLHALIKSLKPKP
ncbi:MAG: four helix bundle protein [Desulfobacterales bacterium]